MSALWLCFSVNLARCDTNRFGRTNELAELAGNTFFASVGVFDQCRHATIIIRYVRTLFWILQGHSLLQHCAESRLQTRNNLREESLFRESQRLTFENFSLSHRDYRVKLS